MAKNFLQDKLLEWLDKGIVTVLGDIAEFADSLYPVFVITCLIGIYLKMFGAEEKGAKMSSISLLSYLIVKVMANVCGK